ncbi:hypothetical protein MW887_010833 [Aspergillus wentii]|nr:hypothetical protein MW887_010833 [Aspergillus wentii]
MASLWAYLAIAGIVSHLAYFKHDEHHMYSIRYVQAATAILAAGSIFIQKTQQKTWIDAVTQTSTLSAYYLTGLFSSLLIYRVLFHPLRKFPGPFFARTSALWFASKLSARDAHKHLLALHNKYGPILRIGPSDLSIINPSAVTTIYGPASRCQKGPWYDLADPDYSLQTFRDRPSHDKSRRAWSTAFSDKTLRGYEERIRVYRRRLVDSLTSMQGESVNVTKWFGLYNFDVMGDLAFGEGFQCLENGEEHWSIKMLLGVLAQLGLYFPAWNKPDIPDISAALIAPQKGRKPTAEERHILRGDSRLIIIAGSDTSAATLAAIFYELMRHPDEVVKLRAELAPHMDDNGEFSHTKISTLDHLNGVINEALRLHPPVPGAVHRKTPPEGIEVDGVHIPGNTDVSCPQYVIGRSELTYARPNEFLPQRWYSEPNLVKDKSAFAPFNIGPYGCIGKPLALLNIRATVAQILMTFDVSFAPGEKGDRFVGQAKDNFVMYMGDLDLVFRRR